MSARDGQQLMAPSNSIFNKPKPVVHLPGKLLSDVTEAVQPYPIPPGTIFEYGTAGFRMKAHAGLDHVVFTVGMTACLRSKRRKAVIGIMITASHNPAEDNGVKLVDPMGDMLEESWEAYATTLANTANENIGKAYEALVNETLVDHLQQVHERPATVVFARDTRASGPHLVKALKAALDVLQVSYTDHGLLTTPQLHYIVRCLNTAGTDQPYGEPTEKGYYEKMAKAFKQIMLGRSISGSVTVDCANGVGGPKLHELIKHLPTAKEGGIDIAVVNDDVVRPEALNYECGADYVKTRQRSPLHAPTTPLARICSLDGDADRLIYHYTDAAGHFQLLDGDRLATLFAVFLRDVTLAAGLSTSLSIGLVQTAYANGASTTFIEKVLQLPVLCTNTGVKHLHRAARQFDVGIYFEANGHGTVTFSERAVRLIRITEAMSPRQAHALSSLAACLELVNQTVGDALSDLLMAEVVLAQQCWSAADWSAAYTDLPNRLVKVEVADRGIFKAVDAERRLESPAGAQEEIDRVVGLFVRGRAFARASGTEDAVRVYAEAFSRAEADDLAGRVVEIVKRFGSGLRIG